MNRRPECAVKGCKREAFIRYGDKWICGYCMVRIIDKEKEVKNKELEELEI